MRASALASNPDGLGRLSSPRVTRIRHVVQRERRDRGPTVGRKIAEQVRLSFGLMAEQLRSLRAQLLLTGSLTGTGSALE